MSFVSVAGSGGFQNPLPGSRTPFDQTPSSTFVDARTATARAASNFYGWRRRESNLQQGGAGLRPVPGVLAHGFARVRCESCKDELLVAFSCKGRGVCPSCNAKRAHVTAVHWVEHEALAARVVRTPEHKAWRQEKSAPLLEQFKRWLEQQAPLHPPKGPLGMAMGYVRGQWASLGRFVEDARLPLDNNRGEQALRTAAVGRNLAGLYSLVATCGANETNPEAYLADVLMRVRSHPNSRLDELLPVAWKRPRTADTS